MDANGEHRDDKQSIRRDKNKTYIDLVADLDGLVCPIEIDPTVAIQPSEPTSKDTYIQNTASTSSFGTAAQLRIGNNGNIYRSLIQFDLSSISGKIINAEMILFANGNYSANAYYIDVYGTDLIGSENPEVRYSPFIHHALLTNDAYIHFNCPYDWRTECPIEREETLPKGILHYIQV